MSRTSSPLGRRGSIASNESGGSRSSSRSNRSQTPVQLNDTMSALQQQMAATSLRLASMKNTGQVFSSRNPRYCPQLTQSTQSSTHVITIMQRDFCSFPWGKLPLWQRTRRHDSNGQAHCSPIVEPPADTSWKSVCSKVNTSPSCHEAIPR